MTPHSSTISPKIDPKLVIKAVFVCCTTVLAASDGSVESIVPCLVFACCQFCAVSSHAICCRYLWVSTRPVSEIHGCDAMHWDDGMTGRLLLSVLHPRRAGWVSILVLENDRRGSAARAMTTNETSPHAQWLLCQVNYLQLYLFHPGAERRYCDPRTTAAAANAACAAGYISIGRGRPRHPQA